MKTVIGLDIGGSATKIVGFAGENMYKPMFVKAADPLTSAYGAFGKFLDENRMALSDIEKVVITGVGSSHLSDEIYGIPVEHVSEFDCIGRGAMYLTGLDKAIVVSMGTGTAIVKCEKGTYEYLGGTGIGGGTITGLSKLLLGMEHVNNISALASSGNYEKTDLLLNVMTKKELSGLQSDLTASNFGNVGDTATKGDIAAGIINMVFETVAMMSIFCARSANIEDIVMTGSLTQIEQCAPTFARIKRWFGKNFIIPEESRFATVIGAALANEKK